MRYRIAAVVGMVAGATLFGAQAVQVIAGNGKAGFSAEQLSSPFGLVVGPDDGLYFAEYGNHTVRRLDLKTRKLTTIAGTGEAGYSGDRGPAESARLHSPHDLCFDRNRNLYIADTFNHTVRRRDAKTGVLTTVAGTGKPGFGGDGGPAASALLNQPTGLAFDKMGRLIVCDTANHRLRRIDLKTNTIETIAGTGERKAAMDGAALAQTPLNGPRAIAAGKGGELYIALRDGNQLYRIDGKEQQLEWIAGTGDKGFAGEDAVATMAKLNGPKGLAASGRSVLVADTENHAIRVVELRTGKARTLLGQGGRRGTTLSDDPLKCLLNRPHGVWAQPDGTVYVSDSENHRILMFKVKL